MERGGRSEAREDKRAGTQGEVRTVPQWAEGLYYNKELISEVLVYHDDEALYVEHRGKESSKVRYSFEMLETLTEVEEEIEEERPETLGHNEQA
jgi:hypothetical protein